MSYLLSLNRFVLVSLVLLASSQAHSALITYEFEGTFNSGNSLFGVGDTFTGSYTFESTSTATSSHPAPSLNTQTIAINNSLPGTVWKIDVSSSTISDFSVSGTFGVISVGDNTATFGDRYSVTLSAPGGMLPGGLGLNYFQIDLQDLTSNGADMLADNAFQSLPNLALASYGGGRFFASGDTGGCTQCSFTLTSLTGVSPVPVPAAVWLFGTALLGLSGFGKRRKAV